MPKLILILMGITPIFVSAVTGSKHCDNLPDPADKRNNGNALRNP